MRLLAFLVAGAASGPALCANWIEVIDTESGIAAISVDLESVRLDGNLRVAWVRATYKTAQELKARPPKHYRMTKRLEVLDCRTGALATKRMVFYSGVAGGSVVHTWDAPADTKLSMREMAPESVGEHVLRIICAQKPP